MGEINEPEIKNELEELNEKLNELTQRFSILRDLVFKYIKIGEQFKRFFEIEDNVFVYGSNNSNSVDEKEVHLLDKSVFNKGIMKCGKEVNLEMWYLSFKEIENNFKEEEKCKSCFGL